MEPLLVSACLLGCKCRYDGKSCPNEAVIALKDTYYLIPVCPEQLGGLSTPRLPSEITPNGVFMKDGTDVTYAYRLGAETALFIAQTLDVKKAVLKAKSPSCGNTLVYDGSFSGTLVPGSGITAGLLQKNGVTVYNENETDLLLNSRMHIDSGSVLL